MSRLHRKGGRGEEVGEVGMPLIILDNTLPAESNWRTTQNVDDAALPPTESPLSGGCGYGAVQAVASPGSNRVCCGGYKPNAVSRVR